MGWSGWLVRAPESEPARAVASKVRNGGKQSDWSSERPTTPEQLLAAMGSAGVAKAAGVQASTAYGHNFSYLADSPERFPERFPGAFSIDPLDPKVIEARQWRTRRHCENASRHDPDGDGSLQGVREAGVCRM